MEEIYILKEKVLQFLNSKGTHVFDKEIVSELGITKEVLNEAVQSMVNDRTVLKEAYGDGGRAYFIRLAPGTRKNGIRRATLGRNTDYDGLSETSTEIEKLDVVFKILHKESSPFFLNYPNLFIPREDGNYFDARLNETGFVKSSNPEAYHPAFKLNDKGYIMMKEYGSFAAYKESLKIKDENLHANQAHEKIIFPKFPKKKYNRFKKNHNIGEWEFDCVVELDYDVNPGNSKEYNFVPVAEEKVKYEKGLSDTYYEFHKDREPLSLEIPKSQPAPTPETRKPVSNIASLWSTVSKHPLWSAVIAGIILLVISIISHFLFGSP